MYISALKPIRMYWTGSRLFHPKFHPKKPFKKNKGELKHTTSAGASLYRSKLNCSLIFSIFVAICAIFYCLVLSFVFLNVNTDGGFYQHQARDSKMTSRHYDIEWPSEFMRA